jgi:hypothetical protein
VRRWFRIAAVLGSLAILASLPATAAARVDLNRETHFRCYIVSTQTPEPAETVTLTDQFLDGVTLDVDEPLQFCAPTSKNGLPIVEPEEHLTMYAANHELTPHLIITTEDQFGPRTLEVVGARVLLVPTQKLVGDLGFPDELNHFWCYEGNGPRVAQRVTLDDQFGADAVRVTQPVLFCNPVEKVHDGVTTPIEEEDVHLTCYDLKGPQRTEAMTFGVFNQLETDMYTVTAWELLCVPSEKTDVQPAS